MTGRLLTFQQYQIVYAKLELNTAEGEAYSTRLKIGNIFKQGGTADDAKRSIETFSNKWGDRDFGGSLTIFNTNITFIKIHNRLVNSVLIKY
jgi:hypothetical protein